MRSDEERIAELHKKAGRLRAERARRRFRAAAAASGAVCAALLAALVLSVSASGPAVPPAALQESGMASIFTSGGALGCVVVAVGAFVLGVLFTLLCARLKKRMGEKEPEDDRKP